MELVNSGLKKQAKLFWTSTFEEGIFLKVEQADFHPKKCWNSCTSTKSTLTQTSTEGGGQARGLTFSSTKTGLNILGQKKTLKKNINLIYVPYCYIRTICLPAQSLKLDNLITLVVSCRRKKKARKDNSRKLLFQQDICTALGSCYSWLPPSVRI